MKYVIDIPDNAGWIEYYSPINEENTRFKGTAVGIDQLEPYIEPNRKAIEVGDEVEYFCGGNIRFVVCGIDNGTAYGFKYRPDFEDLDIGEYCDIDELKKTGRHFPEVAELLKKMRGEEYEETYGMG